MATFNLVSIPAATFDDVSRQLTIDCTNAAYTDKIPAVPTNEEQIEVGFILALEAAAAGKRTDLDAPVSNADALDIDSPNYQFVSRENADATVTETQLEYIPNLRLWMKADVVNATNAVNDND
ncbi:MULTISPECIES: hypothetical protein [unclassified Picosynechococcus]|uniref:hypothetical protein n=1 Tax=unclassified Picosynechococcus TaxID=3079910 RepID=UPI0007457CE5|nr:MULTISPECIES: hypothetical protein [unclassified Picosynechococcus]AMA07907.1 hypothetical protein AWQ23_00440 [Picosynechococcus sp. PCC 73109]ANV89227.1 hypothetical protein AWQ24_00390 [Picosynechococcus sp. PCC 8807]